MQIARHSSPLDNDDKWLAVSHVFSLLVSRRQKKTLALLAKNREGSSQCCGLALLLFMLKNLGYNEFENYTCTYSLGSLPQEIPVLDDRFFFVLYEFPAVHHFGIW